MSAYSSLVIFDSSNNIVDIVRINEKGYKKSLENSVLWYIHEETGRLIPYGDISEGRRLVSLKKGKSWYEAVLKGPDDKAAGEEEKIKIESSLPDVLARLSKTIEKREAELPEGSYTTHLFKSGLNKIRKKTGEEAVELILAENREEIVYEAADLIYHMMVMFQAEKIEFKNVLNELETRM